MAQDKVICPEADFSELRLDHHIVDGRIKDIPTEEDDKVDLESNLANSEADPIA